MAVLERRASTPSPSRRCAGSAGVGGAVHRRRRPGSPWSALGAIFADLLPIPSPTDMDLLGKRALPSAEHWLGNDHARPRRALAPDLWRPHLADRRPAGAGDRRHDRRRARHAGGLLPRPARDLRRRRRRRAAGLPAAGVRARRHRLSRPVGRQHHPGDRRPRHPGLHPRGARRHAVAQRARVRDRGARARRHPQPASCCASCCPTWRCRWSPSSCSASPSPSSSRARSPSSASACRRRRRAGAA